MPFQFSDFVSSPSRHDLARQLHGTPPFPPQLQHCLLSGPQRSGKTSLLFHYAWAMAKAGKSVLLLCARQKVEQVPPLLPEGVSHSDPAWQRVQVKYLDDGVGLLRYASSLHLLDVLPDVLLVDDLHLLLDLPPADRRPREMGACRIMALLHDAVLYMSQKKGQPCMLVATEATHAEGPRFLYLSQRWLPLVLSIKALDGTFSLSPLPTPGAGALLGWQVEYSLKRQCLALEAVRPTHT